MSDNITQNEVEQELEEKVPAFPDEASEASDISSNLTSEASDDDDDEDETKGNAKSRDGDENDKSDDDKQDPDASSSTAPTETFVLLADIAAGDYIDEEMEKVFKSCQTKQDYINAVNLATKRARYYIEHFKKAKKEVFKMKRAEKKAQQEQDKRDQKETTLTVNVKIDANKTVQLKITPKTTVGTFVEMLRLNHFPSISKAKFHIKDGDIINLQWGLRGGVGKRVS